jgi:dolichyl-phosphate-mannose--protein O-mannosyl transferase
LRAWLADRPTVHPANDLSRTWGASWSTVERLRDDTPLRRDEPFSWVVTLLLTVVAFVIRFPKLGQPPYIEFDETYYAKDAWSMLNLGYPANWPSGADDQIKAGITNGWGSGPEYVVHPLLGKYLIAAGEWLFGMTPFGWRIASLIFGVLFVTVVIRMARRLSRSTLVGAMAGLFICVDGLSVVMSRIALLDIFEAFFTVAAVAAVVRDRDWFRERLARYLETNRQHSLGGAFGPIVLWRPWRLLAGVLFGLACGCKWNAMYVLALMGIASVVFDWRARRTAGARATTWQSIYKDGLLAFGYLVVVAVVVYLGTWAQWLINPNGYDRQWGAQNPNTESTRWFGTTAASLWHYHVDIWHSMTGLVDTHHAYDAKPWGWLVIARPISIAFSGNIDPGTSGCPTTGTDTCYQVVLGIGTPFLWWMAALALVAGLFFWIFGRDWRFAIPVLGMAGTWIGWFPNDDRSLFYFYAIMIIPFTATILAMCFGKILGPPSGGRRRQRGAIIVGICVAIIVLNFIFIYPILTYQTMTRVAWSMRMWFRSWI